MAVRNRDNEWERTRKVGGHDRDEQAAMKALLRRPMFRSGRIGEHSGHLTRTCHLKIGTVRADSKAKRGRSSKKDALSAIDYATREGEYKPPKDVDTDLLCVSGDTKKMREIVKDIAKNVVRKVGPQAESIVKTLTYELPEIPLNATEEDIKRHLEKIRSACDAIVKRLADQGYYALAAAHNHDGNIHVHVIAGARRYIDGKIDRTGAKTVLDGNGKVLSREYGSMLWQYKDQVIAERHAVANLINQIFDGPVRFFGGKDREMDRPGLAMLDENGQPLFDQNGRMIMRRPPKFRIPEAEYRVHGERENADELRSNRHSEWQKKREEGRENANRRRAEKAERDRLRLERLAQKTLEAENREAKKRGRKPGSSSPPPADRPWEPATAAQRAMVAKALVNNHFSIREDWAEIVDGGKMAAGIRVAEKLKRIEGLETAQEHLDGVIAQALTAKENDRLKAELATRPVETEGHINLVDGDDTPLPEVVPASIRELNAPKKWEAPKPGQIRHVEAIARGDSKRLGDEKVGAPIIKIAPDWYKTFDGGDAVRAIAVAKNLFTLKKPAEAQEHWDSAHQSSRDRLALELKQDELTHHLGNLHTAVEAERLAKEQAENEAKAAAKKAEEEAAKAAQEAENNRRLQEVVNEQIRQLENYDEMAKKLEDADAAANTTKTLIEETNQRYNDAMEKLSEVAHITAEEIEGRRLVEAVNTARNERDDWSKVINETGVSNWDTYTKAKVIVAEAPIDVLSRQVIYEQSRRAVEHEYNCAKDEHRKWNGIIGFQIYDDKEYQERANNASDRYTNAQKAKNDFKYKGWGLAVDEEKRLTEEKEQQYIMWEKAAKVIERYEALEQCIKDAEAAVRRNLAARAYAIQTYTVITGMPIESITRDVPTDDQTKKKKGRKKDEESNER